MIERTVIDGQDAVVAYLDRDGNPTEANNAAVVKVVFDNGNVIWGVPADTADSEEKA